MPSGPAFDAAGNLYFGDNAYLRVIDRSGIISTAAGGSTYVGDGAPALLTAIEPSYTVWNIAVAATPTGQILFTSGNQVKVLIPSVPSAGCQYNTIAPTSTAFGSRRWNRLRQRNSAQEQLPLDCIQQRQRCLADDQWWPECRPSLEFG